MNLSNRAIAGVAAATVCAALGALYLRIRRRASSRPVVTQLYVYPIKSCSGMKVDALPLTPHGVQYDREWAVFRRRNNNFCSQRDFPIMKRIRAVLVGTSGGGLCIRVSLVTDASTLEEDTSVQPLLVSITKKGATTAADNLVEIDVFGLSGSVEDVGTEPAAWFSALLKEQVFLGRVHPDHRRDPTTMATHGPFVPQGTTINLQDATALHVCTEESIEQVRRVLRNPTMEVHRFRPNVVVRNVALGAEDTWLRFQFLRSSKKQKQPSENGGETVVVECETLKLTSRCSTPTIGPKGERTKAYQPTAYLTENRSASVRGGEKKPMFGLSVQFTHPEVLTKAAVELRVGDEVQVTATQPSPWE